MKNDLVKGSSSSHVSENTIPNKENSAMNELSIKKPFAETTGKSSSDSPFLTEDIGAIEKTTPAMHKLPENQGLHEKSGTNIIDKGPADPVQIEKKPKNINWYKITISTIFLCSILVALAGTYYYFATKKPSENASVKNNTDKEPQKEPEQQVNINPALEKFSATSPNYLILDVAASSSEEIMAAISKTASELAASNSPELFEFIVTDTNNNPVSFSIFSIASGIKLPQEALKTFGENFSLFMKNDGENIHISLAVPTTDESTVKTEMLKNESQLKNNIKTIFLNETFSSTSNEFSTGHYGAISTRYLNSDKGDGFSIDYSITGGVFYLATSKEALRSSFDRYSQLPQR